LIKLENAGRGLSSSKGWPIHFCDYLISPLTRSRLYADLFRRAAEMVDKILNGTKPSDIPVEQPSKFELAIKSRDGSGDWSHSAVSSPRSRRRSDRISWPS
jgi:hypothetical protein